MVISDASPQESLYRASADLTLRMSCSRSLLRRRAR